MKNFNWSSFTLRITVKAPLSTIYNAWTTTAEIEKWFLKQAIFRNDDNTVIDNTTNVSAGQSYEWRWYLYEEVETGTYQTANGTDHIAFSFAGDCVVDIKLSQQGDMTIVELTQHNIPEDEESMRNIRLGCHSGWSFYLVNLKSVYEGGLDLRNKDPDLKVMLNN